MPKLRAIFSRVSRPFWWPMTTIPCPSNRAQATDDRRVVPVEPVAVELDEVLEEEPDEVARVGALGWRASCVRCQAVRLA